jgi:hypothetical protein
LSPDLYCMKANVKRRTPKVTRREMMRGEFQPWRVPPHWRARRRQVMLGMINRVPSKSSFCSFWRNDSCGSDGGGAGSLKPKKIRSIERAQSGKFIPKQARQLKESLNAPPMTGALTRATD